MQVNDLDRKILQILTENADTKYKEIAKQLNTTPVTIHNRLKKLETLGVLNSITHPVINVHKLGFEIHIAVTVTAKGSNLVTAAEKWGRDKNVSHCWRMAGEEDILIIAFFKNGEELNDFNIRLASDELITKTNTRLIFQTFKDSGYPVIY